MTTTEMIDDVRRGIVEQTGNEELARMFTAIFYHLVSVARDEALDEIAGIADEYGKSGGSLDFRDGANKIASVARCMIRGEK